MGTLIPGKWYLYGDKAQTSLGRPCGGVFVRLLHLFNCVSLTVWRAAYIRTGKLLCHYFNYWGRVTFTCVSEITIIGSDSRRQAIIWTNDGILLIGSLGTNFSEILIKIYTFSFKKMHWKMSSGKWRPTCLGLNVLRGLRQHQIAVVTQAPGAKYGKFKICIPTSEVMANHKWVMVCWILNLFRETNAQAK